MDWTKILNKGWISVIQTIIIIIMFVYIIVGNGTGSGTDNSIREDISSLREHVERIEANNSEAITIIDGLIDSNERVVNGLNQLGEENRRAREIATELADDNREHTSRIRTVQDTALNSEFTTDRVKQILREIERTNNFD